MIFYFSATGNSKYTAQRIAEATGETIVSIADCMKHETFQWKETGESVGIVSPTYDWGLPVIVQKFLQKLTFARQPKYMWFAATYGTTTGQIGYFAQKACRYTIHAQFCVKMPDTWTPVFDLSNADKVRRINEAAEIHIDTIIQQICSHAAGDFMHNKVPLAAAKLFYQRYDRQRRTERFTVLDTCVGCGLCAKQCPVSAITIQEKKPVWVKKQCVLCLGCLHHCPAFAIQYGNRTKKHGQYVHP